MDREFRWNDWNADHATKHGCTIPEIESVVRNPERGSPRNVGGGKYRTYGRGTGNRLVEVIFVLDDDGTTFVIHAMPVTTRRRRSR